MKNPIIIAHYMTWYQTPEISGSWGFWKVNRPGIDQRYWHDPDQIDERGWRDVASVYHPVIGPYDSGDPDACAYHILQARLSGIDAFICDWYGFEPFEEHPYDATGFKALLSKAEELNFKVAVCWEDRSMFVNATSRADAVQNACRTLKRMKTDYFSSPAYLQMDGRPVLMNFAWYEPGPKMNETSFSAVEWDSILKSVSPRPLFVHDYHTHHNIHEFDGYDSLAPWGSCLQGRTDVPEFWDQARAARGHGRFSFLSGTVRPGFDNRGCGGWGNDITTDDRKEGQVFRDIWENVLKQDVRFIQIATWNDWNEGGTIEPTREGVAHTNVPAEGYGYRELEVAQDYIARIKGGAFSHSTLRLPAEWYALRKRAQSLPLGAERDRVESEAEGLLKQLVKDCKKYD